MRMGVLVEVEKTAIPIQYYHELEAEVARLKEEIEKLKQENMKLRIENEKLRQQIIEIS